MLSIRFESFKLSTYLSVNEVWTQTMGKWNVSEAYLQTSGTQGCLLSSQLLIAIRAVGWLLPSWSSCCKTAACLRVTSSLPKLPCSLKSLVHISNVFLISSTSALYLDVKRREKRGHFLRWEGQPMQEGRWTPLSGITTEAVESRPEVS